MTAIFVHEGIGATWFYHLQAVDHDLALCGGQTLDKPLPLRLWGYRGHLNERYCAKCEAEAQLLNVPLPARSGT